MCTFMQLYEMRACFTDVTDIVRDRIISFPFEFLMRYVLVGCITQGIFNVESFIKEEGDAKNNRLVLLLHSILSGPIMDAKQTEYFSDYALRKVEVVDKNVPETGATGAGEKVVYVMSADRSYKIRIVFAGTEVEADTLYNNTSNLNPKLS
jgi:hypothetical protein